MKMTNLRLDCYAPAFLQLFILDLHNLALYTYPGTLISMKNPIYKINKVTIISVQKSADHRTLHLFTHTEPNVYVNYNTSTGHNIGF